jgi:hypothetical protein
MDDGCGGGCTSGAAAACPAWLPCWAVLMLMCGSHSLVTHAVACVGQAAGQRRASSLCPRSVPGLEVIVHVCRGSVRADVSAEEVWEDCQPVVGREL